MEIIRTWLLSVTVSAMVIAAAEALMPAGAVKRVGKLTGGLILVLPPGRRHQPGDLGRKNL